MKSNSRLKLAIAERSRSIGRKLPIVVFAAVACYGLYYLDSVKKGFDEAKSRPLLVDDKFKQQLEAEVSKKKDDGGAEAWNGIKKFISVSQYTTENDFINKVVARISRAADAEEFVARAELNGCVAKALATPSPGAEATTPVSKTPEECSADFTAADLKSYTETQTKIANVYRYLKPISLKGINDKLEEDARKTGPPRTTGQLKPKGYLEASLQPILDDQTDLYVIYQVFRMALVVVIVFTLITIIALLLGTLLLADSARTFTEQAKSFIGGGKGTVLPSVVKTAMVSVAALGVGTAVAAGVAINNKADLALAQHDGEPYAAGRTTSSSKGPNDPARPRDGAHYDSTNTQYDFAASYYDYTQDNRTGATLPPVIEVFPKVSVADSGTGTTNVGLDSALTTKMDTYFESMTQLNKDTSTELVTKMRTSLDSLTKANTDLSAKIALLTTPSRSDDIRVANQDLLKPLMVDFEADSQNLLSINKLNTTLEELQRLNLDKPSQPKTRSFLWGRLFQSDKYFVSKRALEQLKELIERNDAKLRAEQKKLEAELQNLQKNGQSDPIKLADQKKTEDLITEKRLTLRADAAILTTMERLYLLGGTPLDKKTLFKQIDLTLRDVLESQSPKQAIETPLERLDLWHSTILTYTRIP